MTPRDRAEAVKRCFAGIPGVETLLSPDEHTPESGDFAFRVRYQGQMLLYSVGLIVWGNEGVISCACGWPPNTPDPPQSTTEPRAWALALLRLLDVSDAITNHDDDALRRLAGDG